MWFSAALPQTRKAVYLSPRWGPAPSHGNFWRPCGWWNPVRHVKGYFTEWLTSQHSPKAIPLDNGCNLLQVGCKIHNFLARLFLLWQPKEAHSLYFSRFCGKEQKQLPRPLLLSPEPILLLYLAPGKNIRRQFLKYIWDYCMRLHSKISKIFQKRQTWASAIAMG